MKTVKIIIKTFQLGFTHGKDLMHNFVVWLDR